MTDAIAVLATQGLVTGVEMQGLRFDTGNPLGLLRASIHYGLKSPELRDDLMQMLRQFVSQPESSSE